MNVIIISNYILCSRGVITNLHYHHIIYQWGASSMQVNWDQSRSVLIDSMRGRRLRNTWMSTFTSAQKWRCNQ